MLNSLRKGLLLTTILITSLSTLAGLGVFAGLTYQQQKNELDNRLTEHAKTIAAYTSQQIHTQPDEWQALFPQLLEPGEFVLNAHVYTYDDAGQLNFQTSYNPPGTAPIASRANAAEELSTTRFSQRSADIMLPVISQEDGSQLGYLFMRADTAQLTQSIQRYLYTALFVLIAVILLSILMASLLSRFFSKPLHRLIRTTEEVARTRNYTIRLKPASFYELDLLSHNFNTILSRIEQHIVQHQKAEAAAHQLTSELENQVEQRTNALRQANQELLDTLEQLHQHQGRQVEAQKMSSLSELVAGISHEVNTPLGLAVTAASMLENSLHGISQEEQAREHLTIVQRNLDRAVELINNFKKLAIEHASEESRAVKFADLIDDIITSARSYIPGAEQVEFNLTSDLDGLILAKTGVWQQLLLSLIENSVIHAFQGGSNSQIHIEVISGNNLEVRYRDNGIGVPNDILQRIYDPFVTSKRGQGNSGLGMHLVYNLVTHTLNGSIKCQSTPEDGFEVSIKCPFERVNER